MDYHLLGQSLAIQQLKTLEKPQTSIKSLETLETLRNPFLETQASFIDLRGHLEHFYQEKCEGLQATKWKEVLYSSLYSLLSEAVYTTDKGLQLKLLSKISKWFYSKITPAKPTSLYPAKATSTEPIQKSRAVTLSMRSTAADSFNKSKTSTPQPRTPNIGLKTTYQAYVNPIPPVDPEIEARLDKYFQALQERQAQRLNLGKYRERRIQEWSEFKSQRMENLNIRREIASFSFASDTHDQLNSTLVDFSKSNKAEKSFDSEESEEKYGMFSRPGVLRKIRQKVIDIEQIPKKRKEGLDDFPDFVSPSTSPGMGREKMNELFSIKSKLARKGIKSDLRELELGIIDAQTKVQELSKFLPSGGESLLINPFVQVKSKSKKKSKKKKSKKG